MPQLTREDMRQAAIRVQAALTVVAALPLAFLGAPAQVDSAGATIYPAAMGFMAAAGHALRILQQDGVIPAKPGWTNSAKILAYAATCLLAAPTLVDGNAAPGFATAAAWILAAELGHRSYAKKSGTPSGPAGAD